jgi:polyisoprenoid-binding protein YceI
MSGRRAARMAEVFGRCAAFAALLLALGWVPARAESLYTIDPRVGSIEFSVRHLGLFSSHGWFRQFLANLTIDAAHPEWTRIAARIEAGSVDMSWQGGADMLRSAEFFDVRDHPEIRFGSTSVGLVAPDRYAVHGRLEIRGVVQPVELQARVVDRQFDRARGAEVADFVITGRVSRRAFGMVAEPTFVSDAVDLTIRTRIEIRADRPAG